MSVDYRLLNHFRVSQRRELAARGVVAAIAPVTAPVTAPITAPVTAPERLGAAGRAETPEPRARGAKPAQKPVQRPVERPAQVLTPLLNEDR